MVTTPSPWTAVPRLTLAAAAGLLVAALAVRWEPGAPDGVTGDGWLWASAPWRLALVTVVLVAVAVALLRPNWVSHTVARVVAVGLGVTSVPPLARAVGSIGDGAGPAVVPAVGGGVALAAALIVGLTPSPAPAATPESRRAGGRRVTGSLASAAVVVIASVVVPAVTGGDGDDDMAVTDGPELAARRTTVPATTSSAALVWFRPAGLFVSGGDGRAGVLSAFDRDFDTDVVRWGRLEIVSVDDGELRGAFEPEGLMTEPAWTDTGPVTVLYDDDETVAPAPVVVALDGDGNERWRQTTPGVDQVVATPGVVAAVGPHRATGLDTATGAPRWTAEFDADTTCTKVSALSDGGLIVVGRECGATLRLTGLAAETGDRAWSRDLSGHRYEDGSAGEDPPPALFEAVVGETLLVTDHSGLNALAVTDGELRWHDPGSTNDAFLTDGAGGLWRKDHYEPAGQSRTRLRLLERIDPATGAVRFRADLTLEQRASLDYETTIRRAGDRAVVTGGNGVGEPLAPAARRRFGGVAFNAETGADATAVVFGDVDAVRQSRLASVADDLALFEIFAPGVLRETGQAVDVWLVAVRLP